MTRHIELTAVRLNDAARNFVRVGDPVKVKPSRRGSPAPPRPPTARRADMADDETPVLEEHDWIYLGRVVTSSDKLGSRWIDDTGAERIFAANAHGKVIGGIYKIKTTADNARAIINKGGGEGFTVNENLNPEHLAEWRLADRAAYLDVEGRKAERRLAKDNDDFGKMSLQQFRHIMAMSGPMQRAGMKVALFRYLGV